MLLNCGVGEDSWESLGLQGDQTSLKGNQSSIFIGKTEAEAEASVFWPPHAKNWITEKDPVAGKDWRQEEKGTTEDEMVGWHHRLNGHEFKQAPGVGDGQGSLAYCSLWGCKELDTAKWLSWLNISHFSSTLSSYLINISLVFWMSNFYQLWQRHKLCSVFSLFFKCWRFSFWKIRGFLMYINSWNKTTQEKQKGFWWFFFFSPMTPPCESASLAEHFSGPCFSNSSYDLTEDFSQRFWGAVDCST